MKKIYLLLSFAAASLISLNAQFEMSQKTHGIVAGNSHSFIFTEPAEAGAAGKNVTWDFSGLKANEKTLTSHMFNSLETPKGTEIPYANTAIEEFGAAFYFKETKNSIEHYGYISGNSIIKYSKPLLKLKFPLKYGDKFTGDYAGTQSTGNYVSDFNGSYEISCDAYGKLILPQGIVVNNTIRVKQSRTYNCQGGCNYTEIIYRWYGLESHYPLLVIIENKTEKGDVSSHLTAYHPLSILKQAPAEAESLLADKSVELQYFPNPWGEKLSIKYTLQNNANVEVTICDYSGNLVKTIIPSTLQEKGHYSYSVSDKNLKAGVYFLKFKYDNEVITKKIIKAF